MKIAVTEYGLELNVLSSVIGMRKRKAAQAPLPTVPLLLHQ